MQQQKRCKTKICKRGIARCHHNYDNNNCDNNYVQIEPIYSLISL